MSQNVTFLFSNPTIAEIPPLTHPTAIILQKPACKSRRGHLGAWFDPLGSVPTAIYPLCCSAAAACIFRFQHALSPNFVTSIDSSPREQRTRFHPVPPFTNIMTEGGSICLVLGSVNCAVPITPNLAVRITKGTYVICKSP